MPEVGRTGSGEHVQSVLFWKAADWTEETSKTWCEEHEYFVDGYDETESQHRWRQVDPDDEEFNYRTTIIQETAEGDSSIALLLGIPKEKSLFKRAMRWVRKTFGASEPVKLSFTLLGTNPKQKPNDEWSFGIAVESGGTTILVDPGSDIEQQVWKFLGDAKVKGIVHTHENHEARKAASFVQGNYPKAVVYSEKRATLGPFSQITELPGVTVKAFRVSHEIREKTLGFVVEQEERKAVIVPHASVLEEVLKACEGASLVFLGAGPMSGGDPEYLTLEDIQAAAKALDGTTIILASMVKSDEWLKAMDDLPGNVHIIAPGSQVSLSAEGIEFTEEPSTSTDIRIIQRGFVQVGAGDDGKLSVSLEGVDLPTMKAEIAKGFHSSLRDSIRFDGEAGAGKSLYDLALIPSNHDKD